MKSSGRTAALPAILVIYAAAGFLLAKELSAGRPVFPVPGTEQTREGQQNPPSSRPAGEIGQLEKDRQTQAIKMIEAGQALIEKQRWIILSGGLVLVSLLLTGILLGQREKKKRLTLERELQDAQQSALRQQMNPHFVYNALSSIQYFVLNGDKESANDYIARFSKLMRLILDNSQADLISLEEERTMITLYLEIEAMRFRDGFQYAINGPADPRDLRETLPAFLLQPYVENAIWHGLAPKNGPKHLRLDIVSDTDQISFVIEDDGIGRRKAAEIKAEKYPERRPLGTLLTEKRLQLLNKRYGRNIRVRTTDLTGTGGEAAGTRIEISLNRESPL